MPKTPQDHQAKSQPFEFTVAGKKYKLPPLDEKAASAVPGGLTIDAIMEPDNNAVQLRLAIATLQAAKPSAPAMTALRSLPTEEMLGVVGDWMGEQQGSSGSLETTGEPSTTTGAAASA